MRLKRRQKLALLKWVAEGLSSPEISELAKAFNPPFEVYKQQVDYYRKTRKLDLEAIAHITETNALVEGYALKEHRVYKLSLLAALLEKDLLAGMLWLDDVKGVGAGAAAEVVDIEVFNKAEVEAYRGVLDDIARELGGRVRLVDMTSKGESIQGPTVYLPAVESEDSTHEGGDA